MLSGAAALAALLAAPDLLRVHAQDATPAAPGDDPLSAWNDGPAKRAILTFVAAVTDPDGPGFVPEAGRIAAFDLDGTLWVERPVYVVLMFAEDRARDLIAENPVLAAATPYADLIAYDDGTLASLPEADVYELMVDPFAGETPEDYHELATSWLETAVNEHYGRRVVALTYLPMMQAMRYLEANGFVVFIASAGDLEFLRAHAEPVFGIPPERVIGTLVGLEAAPGDDPGEIELQRTGTIDFPVWNDNKAIAIERHAGLRPIFSAGNSDGDMAMLGWTLSTPGERLAMIVWHDDGVREFDYGATNGMTETRADLEAEGIVVISMKDDFRDMFAPGDGPAITP
ncbi:MAG: haloacid dehalogenase-like hydrolase [Chloroflexota bacterium]